MEDLRGSTSTISSSDVESSRVVGIELQNLTRGAENEPSEIGHVISSDIEMQQTMEGPGANFTNPYQDNDHIGPDAMQREAEVSRSSISSTDAQGHNVNGNIEEANLPVVTISGPVHHIIQPAYNLLREIQRLEHMRELYHAATTGNWNAANDILGEEEQRSALLRLPVLNVTGETALHIAAGAKQVEFVEMLLQEPTIDNFIGEPDASNNTALCTAATAGASEIVTRLWERNNELLFTAGGINMTPAYIAAMFGHEGIASELYSEHIRRRPMGDNDKIQLFFACINNEMFELASRILDNSPDLNLDYRRDSNSETVLHVLARKPSIFASQRQGICNQILHHCTHFTSACNSCSLQDKALTFLKNVISKLERRRRNVLQDIVERPRHLLFEAAALGNYKFVAKLVGSFPDLIWEKDGNGQLIFHAAISNRKLDVFELISGTGVLQSVMQAWEDETTGNNILHIAAKLPPNDVLNSLAGEPFQMQKEVLFFKKLQRFVPARQRDKGNNDGQTPKQVFTLEHEELRQKGEKWMKKNASYCLLVATLIVTVAYPASSIIPGGSNDNNKSFSIHHKAESTSVLVTNATAMGFSIVSMMVFFNILISRFAVEDFMCSLPCKFYSGLASLFVALACMTVSFYIATVEMCSNIKGSS